MLKGSGYYSQNNLGLLALVWCWELVEEGRGYLICCADGCFYCYAWMGSQSRVGNVHTVPPGSRTVEKVVSG